MKPQMHRDSASHDPAKIPRSIDGQFDWDVRARGQVENFYKLAVLVAADCAETFDLPGHDRRKEWTRRLFARLPCVHKHGLPRVLPMKVAGWHRAAIRADIAAKRK